MLPNQFTTQANAQADFQGNKTYTPTGVYPTAFSTGFVSYEHTPKHMIPSYYVAHYAPDVNNERTALEYPNTQGNVFDVVYMGINQANARAMNANGAVAGSAVYAYQSNGQQSIGTMVSPTVYGEFDARGVVHPSMVYISIKFTGIANGTADNAYTAVYGENFAVPDFISLRDGTLSKTFTHAGKTINVLDLSDGVLWRDDEDATGFYFLEYAFVGWGRNTTTGGVGNYSYLYPAIGSGLDMPPIQFPESATKVPTWLVTGAYGSFPYGGFRRSSWGTGIRTRPSGSGILTGVYYEEEGTNRIFVADILNASYASFYCHGYIGNYSGFNASSPVVVSYNTLISTWTLDNLRAYHDKWTEDQRNFYIPEGRGDFGTTVPRVTLEDIWLHMCLLPVWATPGHEYEYAQFSEHFWFAEMSGDEYVGNLLRGDDPLLSEKVPDWITDGDSTKSDYNPDTDRPEPGGDPTEDGPDKIGEGPAWKGKDTGPRTGYSDLLGFPGSMMSLYAMDSSVANAFGASLWASLGSDAFMQNMWTAVFNSATLDFSECLKYFPVCRMYPINLGAALYTATGVSTLWPSSIYFGRATAPITLTGQPYQIRTPIIYGGTCSIDVPDAEDWQDLEPYTSAQIYIPYCGQYPVPVADIVGATINTETYINILTGEMLVYVVRSKGGLSNTLFTATGSIGYDVPLTTDSAALKIGTLAASVGVPALVAGTLGAVTLAGGTMAKAGAAIAKKGAAAEDIAAIDKNMNSDLGDIMRGASGASSGITGALNALGANMTGGVTAITSPNMGGMMGINGCPNMVITLKKTRVVTSGLHGSTAAYPLHHSRTLGDMSGLVKCVNPNVSGITATATELTQIANYLESGVIV